MGRAFYQNTAHTLLSQNVQSHFSNIRYAAGPFLPYLLALFTTTVGLTSWFRHDIKRYENRNIMLNVHRLLRLTLLIFKSHFTALQTSLLLLIVITN